MSSEGQQTERRYSYVCQECGWESDRSFETPSDARTALSSHVGGQGDDHIGWQEYLVKHRLNVCDGCPRPLDTMGLDRCYRCRIDAAGLARYVEGQHG